VCDVPPELAAQLGIALVPAVVIMRGKSYLDDGVQLTREQFYEMMPHMAQLPTTAACPLGVTREIVARQAAVYDHLILIAAPARLSGIYNNFRIAADELAPGRYTLIDSGQVTMGAGFQVIRAAEMAADGASPDDIAAVLADMRPRVHVYGALNTLENLRKSGRVGWVTAIAGRLLQIKPMVELTEGDVKSLDNVRTFKRAFNHLIELAQARAPLEHLAVLHTSNEQQAAAMRDILADIAPERETLIVHVNPALGVHVGAQAVGLAMVTAK
jgi:DegV family protein with EDD domain